MRFMFFLFALIFLNSCNKHVFLQVPSSQPGAAGGSVVYKQINSMKWDEREPILVGEVLSGNIPSFLKKLVPIKLSVKDSLGKKIDAVCFVTSDYLSIGNNQDWARIPLTPMAAQRIADSLQCFLPTRKLVDEIYQQSVVKLEPVPLYAFRDSAIIFWHHHLIIEGQRKNRKGLIAGIKKDVVISDKVHRDAKPNRVAIYGWHKTDGRPIQPLYSGHVNWYVDYSHGIRLVYRKILVEGKWKDYTDILANPVLRRTICDEEFCDCIRY
jgi:hypothetical protein